ncbi:MAG: type II toxin-antitoxin system HicA family toxin [Patescibacteria group bacterium]
MSRDNKPLKLRPLIYSEVIRKARKAGFVFRRRTSGTHEIWWNEQMRKTCVIPHHKEIRTGTLGSIIKQMGVSRNEFLRL